MQERLKEIRKKLGLKQRELAEKLEVSVGMIGGWESGVSIPSKTRIYQICNMFGVNENWLKTGAGEMMKTHTEAKRLEDLELEFCQRVFDSLQPDAQEKIYKILLNQLRIDQRLGRARKLEEWEGAPEFFTVAQNE